MPKKKLTKAQVHKKWRSCTIALYDLFLDKFGHLAESKVTLSIPKLLEMHKAIESASKRMK